MTEFNQQVVIIDCQTSNMHPKNGFILQLGWSLYDPLSNLPPVIHKRLIKPPVGTVIQKKVLKLLALELEDFNTAIEPDVALKELEQAIASVGKNPLIIAHYAQFELTFLKHYFSIYLKQELKNFRSICTQKISKIVLPHLPSYTLKGLAGYFNFENQPYNEVVSHIKTTIDIWNTLRHSLYNLELTNYHSLMEWIKLTPKPIKKTFSYRIDSTVRLQLPQVPGIYKMLSREGQILYIGKATSLNHRVNSYFRGVKNRDKQKLEMLARVWQIDTIECTTVLEAELLESDEIKNFNPPYNIMLKTESRELVFFDKTFTNQAQFFCEIYSQGPFRTMNIIQCLFEAHLSYSQNRPTLLFDTSITTEALRSAWLIVCAKLEVTPEILVGLSRRQLLAIACLRLRRFEKYQGRYSFEKWWSQQKKEHPQLLELTNENLADKILRLFMRAAETLRKARELLFIYRTPWKIVSTDKIVHLKEPESLNPLHLTIVHYDKLTILAAAKRKKLIAPAML